MGLRRDSKQTDVYQPPAANTTLQQSGRRMPLRHSDAPDYDAVSVGETPRRRSLWLLIALLVLAGLGVAAWRIL